jgi:hypothetical protein
MQAEHLKRTLTGRYGLVAAVFTSCAHANDAVADLNREGFEGERIGVACASTAPVAATTLGQEHSFIWRLRRSFQTDLHRSGEHQMAGKGPVDITAQAPAPYSDISLDEALGALGMTPDGISLIRREMGEKGAFVIVDGAGDWQKAEDALQRNSGVIRTDAVTNRMPSPRMATEPRTTGRLAESFDDN